jgi:hypothetical protein
VWVSRRGRGVFAGGPAAPDQQPVLPSAGPGWWCGRVRGISGRVDSRVCWRVGWRVDGVDQCPVVPAFTLAATPGRKPLPRTFRQPGRQVDRRSGPDPGDDLMVLRDRQDVAEAGLAQMPAQLGIGAVDLVCGHPGGGNPRVQRVADHGLSQRGLGREPDLGRNPGSGHQLDIAGPGLRQIQRPIHQRMPLVRLTAGVGQVDRDLRTLDPPRGAGVLALHPDRGGALLQVPGLIDQQDPAARRAGTPPSPARHAAPDPHPTTPRTTTAASPAGRPHRHARPGSNSSCAAARPSSQARSAATATAFPPCTSEPPRSPEGHPVPPASGQDLRYGLRPPSGLLRSTQPRSSSGGRARFWTDTHAT